MIKIGIRLSFRLVREYKVKGSKGKNDGLNQSGSRIDVYLPSHILSVFNRRHTRPDAGNKLDVSPRGHIRALNLSLITARGEPERITRLH